MTNKMSKTVITGSILCSLVLLGVLSTFAYIILSPTETKEDLGVETGSLSLTFADGNNGITQALEFGKSVTKTFTITNTGTLDAVAMINFVDLVNTYINGSLTYSLSFSEEQNGEYTDVVTDENVPRSESASTNELANGLEIQAGKTMYYKLMIKLNYLDDVDQTPDLKAMFSSHFEVEEGNNILVRRLLSNANSVSINDYNSGVKEEMYTFQHEATEQTEALIDYRYIGNNPNNYIVFNDETWRIMGVFETEGENGEKEQRVKIIRDESIGKFSWDNKVDKTYTSEWPTSTLATMLNGNYIKSGGNFTYTYYTGTSTAFNQRTATVKGLNSNSAKQIVSVKWYLSSLVYSSESSDLSASGYYTAERGTTTCATTGKCSGETRSINSFGEVGLMYPSDYLYTFALGIDNTCFQNGYNCQTIRGGIPTNSWLYNDIDSLYTISPNATSSNGAQMVMNGGYVYGGNLHNGSLVLPSVFLKSDIQIDSGNGSQQKPYTIK